MRRQAGALFRLSLSRGAGALTHCSLLSVVVPSESVRLDGGHARNHAEATVVELVRSLSPTSAYERVGRTRVPAEMMELTQGEWA